MHEFRERLAGYVNHELLFDGDPAAGIAFQRAGDDIDADRFGVGGLFAVEDFHQRWPGRVHVVAREAMDRQASGVRHQAAKRSLLRFCEFVLRHFPGFQLLIHVFVEGEFAFLDQVQRAGGRNRFADRAAWNSVLVVMGLFEPASVTP